MQAIRIPAPPIAAVWLAVGAHVGAQTPTDNVPAFGGQSGPDRSIEAIEPGDEPARTGMAGRDPADISRYLLASGADSAQLSPDGEMLALSWSVSGESQLWTMPAAGGQPQRLTFGSGIRFFRWAPDGKRLVYGADSDGNEQPAYFSIAGDGTEERRLLPAAEGGFRAFGDFTGDDIVYASTERNGLDFDIWRAGPDGRTRLLYEGRFAFYARNVSPDGKHLIVTESVGEDSDNLHLLDLEDGALKTLSRPDPRANHGGAGFEWAPDSSGFYFATNRDGEFPVISFFEIGSGETRAIAEPGVAVGDLALCGTADRYLVWTENRDGFHSIRIRDLRSGRPIETIELPEGVYGLSCADRADRLAVVVNGWRTPGDVYTMNLPDGPTVRAFASNFAGLDRSQLVRPESIRVTARDGVALQGLLYLPDRKSAPDDQPPPVVFDVHGGPASQSQASWEPAMQYLLDHGIAVFQPNVRGSTGFGRTYAKLDDRERRLDSVRDLVDLLAHFNDDPRIDTGRAAVRGGSYGGYMVNAVLAEHPNSFSAGVALFGVADWITALQVASPALKASDRIEYGDITESRWYEFYQKNSPINKADRIRVPVLYSHGAMDPRIDIAETETMVKALRSVGIEAPFIRIPDEGHGWRKLENRLFYFRREVDFLKDQLFGD